MLRFYPCSAVLALVLATAAAAPAQTSRPLRLVTYYDSARTQRRAVYGAQLTGARPDTVAHGAFRRFWPGGGLAELGHFSAGQADSIWTRYYPAPPGRPPAVARRLPMRAGQPNGPFVVFHPDGRVAQRGTFRGGQLIDSLVTTTKAGSPRLLARFDSSRAPGLRGTFRQWRGQYTAVFPDVVSYQNEGLSSRNDYPRSDPARYWTGQLAAGRLVGAHTEYDADGEPRVRLSYTAQGHYRLTTLYYPAAWLRNEQGQDQPLPADSIVHSQPLYEWQAVGRRPYLLKRFWDCNYGSVGYQSEDKVFKQVPFETKWNQRTHKYQARPRHLNSSGDLIGELKGTDVPVPLAPVVAAAFIKPVADQSDPACANLAVQYHTHGRPPVQTLALTNGAVLRRYPPLSRYRQTVTLKPVRHPGRWHLGPADTTGVRLRPARQRVTTFASGRLVETRRTTRTYFATGQLQYVRRRGPLHVSDRSYYPNGSRKEKTSAGLLGIFSQTWDEAGHPARRSYESPVDLPRLRKSLKKARPLRTIKRQLSKFKPLRPLYRALRKVFPRHDHHTPRPGKG